MFRVVIHQFHEQQFPWSSILDQDLCLDRFRFFQYMMSIWKQVLKQWDKNLNINLPLPRWEFSGQMETNYEINTR